MIFKKIINELNNTGERPVLETRFEEREPAERFAYALVSKSIKKKDQILDFGCGGGYGTEYLSRFSKNTTVGYDIDKQAIKSCRDFFRENKKLKFLFKKTGLRKDSYSVITALEVIEHLSAKDLRNFLTDLKYFLNPKGTLWVATVNKNMTSYLLKKPVMPFHVHEFYPGELLSLLQTHFASVECYGQIEKSVQKKVREDDWSYQNSYNKGLQVNILRFISQFDLVRIICRYTPIFLRRLFFPFDKKTIYQKVFLLTKLKKEIENADILIYKCKK